MSRSRLGAEIAFVFLMQFTVPATERSEARRGSARLSLIGGKFYIYYPYIMEKFPSIVILQDKTWKNNS